MYSFASTAAALVAAAGLAAGACVEDGGNWYCNQVNAVTYNNFGLSGTYQKVTDVNGCATTPQAYNGSLAPLDEEVTLVFRGPLHLKYFAAYAPGASSSSSSKNARRSATDRRHQKHAHAKFHNQERSLEDLDQAESDDEIKDKKREVIVATYRGETFSWTTNIGAPTSVPPAKVVAAAAAATGASSKPTAANAPTAVPTAALGVGDWVQMASYNASAGQADNIVFLKQNYGPLTYMDASGTSTSEAPSVLEDVLVPSGEEFTIWSNSECSGQNGDCGYYDPANKAYHGFAGASKAFVFAFSMPDAPSTSSSKRQATSLNSNMPAIWMLNSQIPRVDQYGCSCWQSGCGELDLFEVLSPGDTRMKSTLHDAQALGSSDYFQRPVGGVVWAAVVMHDYSATIRILDGPEGLPTGVGAGFSPDALKNLMADAESVNTLPD